MSLRVVDPGLLTLVVDGGRPSHRSLGVPIGGAADRTSLALGNALVGNDSDAAGLEVTLAGPTLRAECDLACVVFGAPFSLTMHDCFLSPGTTFTLPAGKELFIGGARKGVRSYLCVHGGLRTPVLLDSRSGLESVQTDFVLPCCASRVGQRHLPTDLSRQTTTFCKHLDFNNTEPTAIRTVAGPQAEWFNTNPLYDQVFDVTPASNRMGLRLKGQRLNTPDRELVSEPVSPGAVQVTRDGQCIVLGVDGQTIGGYPKIAHVIAADRDLLSQVRPGDQVRFIRTTVDEAIVAYRQAEKELSHWLCRLKASYGLLT